jgi:Xaa-Pro aminopeptidase
VSEFTARQALVAARAATLGFDGILVCSRGGGTVDRFANIFYLANFYSSFPFVPDRKGDWAARAHAFMLLPTAGKPLLITDMPVRQADVPVDDVLTGDDVVKMVVEALRLRNLTHGRIGLVGSDIIPLSTYRLLETELPNVVFIPADLVLDELRMVKSPAEVAILKYSSRLGSAAIEAMMAAAVPGATHGEIMGVGFNVISRAGGILYNNFMSSGRGGNDPVMISSDFPTWASEEPLEEGQWFQIGISGAWRGYFFDHSRSKPIGRSSSAQIESFEAAIAAVEAGIAAIRPEVTAGSVADAGFSRLVELGFSTKSDFSGLGHGVGLGWDSPWLVPGDQTVLVPGMVLCVERSVEKHGYVGDFEETVLVTETGCEILSVAPVRNW